MRKISRIFGRYKEENVILQSKMENVYKMSITDDNKHIPQVTAKAEPTASSNSWWETIYSSVSRFLHDDNSDRGIAELLEEMRIHLEAESVHICELDITGVCMECSFASTGNHVNHPTRPVCRCLYPLLVNRLHDGKPLLIDVEQPDLMLDPHLYTHLQQHHIRQMFVIPLLFKEGLRGFLGMDFAKPFEQQSEQMLAAMDTLSKLLSICLELRRREIEAEDRRNDLSALFAYMPLGYIRIKLIRNEKGTVYDFYVAEANQKLAELTAAPLKSFLYQRGSVVSPNLGQDIHTMQDVLDDGCYRTLNHTFEHSGKLCHIVFYSSRADEVVGLFLDMTEVSRMRKAMKRVEDFEQFFLLISDYAKVGYAKYNLLTRNGYAISQWFKNLGESANRPLKEVACVYGQMHPDDRSLIMNFLEQVKRGEATSFNHEVRIRRTAAEREDVWNWVHVHVVVNSYHPEQELIELICVNYDITALKETEQKLIEAKEKAETADRLKTAFLANMSHEIRTPLNAIVGFSSLLSETDDENERQQYVEIIQENNNLLLQLISDILDISKIEAGTLEFSLKQVNGAKLCREVVENLKGRTQPGVELVCDAEGCDYELSSDPYRLRQVLFNFVSNAIKFTSEGSIHVGCTVTDERHLRFYVSDTGIGITSENLQRIFDRFVKVNTFAQGTGLGLPICKSIIHQLGGEIGVESIPCKGSTFWFILPIDGKTEKEE